MASFNKITIVGYLGRDPELKFAASGNAICNLSVATTEKNKDKETTTWFRVAVWGKQAEICNQYLAKGSQVYIEGRLRQEEYTSKEGNKRYSLEVNASDVRFLDRKGEAGDGEQKQVAKAAAHEYQKNPTKPVAVPDESDIPF